jgi:hypothetical protein
MRYYVYELVIVPGEIVCYVGKGSGRRMWNHKRYALKPPSGTQKYLYRKLSEILASGKQFEPRKVFETDSELEALSEEQRRIVHYGLDSLFNFSSNRTGPVEDQINAARKQAMSKSRKEYVAKLKREKGYGMPPSTRSKISRSLKGRKKSDEHCAKVSSAKKGKCFSGAHLKSLSEAAKKRRIDPAKIEAMRQANLGGHRDNSKALAARKLKYGY